MRLLLAATVFLMSMGVLSGQGLFDTPLSLTNRKTVRVDRVVPLSGRIDVALTMGSWQSEASTYNGFPKDRDPLDSVTQLSLGYERYFPSGIGFDARFLRMEEIGWGVRARGLYRIEPGRTAPVGEGGLVLAAGVFVQKNPLYSDTPTLLFTWGLEWGHRFRSFLSLDVDGFFFVPWAPGFELSPDSRFRIEGQFRFGVFGLFGEIEVLNREYDLTADDNIRCITIKGGLVVFRETDWMIRLGGGMMQKALLQGSGSANSLVGYRNALFEEIGFSGRYRDRGGNLFTYTWGLRFIISQQGRDAVSSGTVWSEGFGEVSFFFSGSLAL